MPITESEPELTEGDEAPPFRLPGADGQEYALADFTDVDALLVVFTCNHCPYAWSKVEALNALTADYDGLAVVGINSNDESQQVEDSFEYMQEYIEDGTIKFDAYLRDADQAVAREYGAVCTPDPFLFRREGEVFRLAYHGRIDDALNPEQSPSTHHMREAVDAVLADEPVEKGFLPSRGCSIKWS